MKHTTELKAVQLLQIYEVLTPANRDRLVELLRALVRSQEADADSPRSEKQKE